MVRSPRSHASRSRLGQAGPFPPALQTQHAVVAALFLLVALTFDRTAQTQFTLPKLIVLRFCAAAIALLWAWRARRGGLAPMPRIVLVPAALLIAWWILVTLLAADARTALHGMHGRYNGLITQLTMVGLFVVMATSGASRAAVRRLLVVFVGALVPVVLYALAQSAGFDPLVWPNARPGSTIGHPVPLAAILGLAIPFLLAFLVNEPRPWQRGVWAALLGTFLLALAATLSRGPQIGAAIAVTFVVAAAVWAGAISRALVLKALAAIAVAFVLASDTNVVTRFATRVAGLARLEADASFTNRFVFYSAALAMVRDHPVAGVGFESFGLLYPRYRSIEPEDLPADTIPTMVHNGYLQAAATTGVPGLALYVALIVSIVVLLVRTCSRFAEPDEAAADGGAARRDWLIGMAFIASIAAYLVQDLSGWQEISLSVFFWMMAGMAVSFCTAGPARRRQIRRRSRLAAAAGGAVVAVALVVLGWDAWTELRADRAFFGTVAFDAGRDWSAIEDRVSTGLRLAGDDPHYLDAAGVLYLKHVTAAGERDAYDRSAAALDRAAQLNRFDPYILVHRIDLDTAALRRKLIPAPSEAAARSAAAALLMDRNNPSVHEAVANFRQAQGQSADALASIRTAARLRPHHPRYHAAEGDTLRAAGDRAGAATAYRREATLLQTSDPAWLIVERKLLVTLLESARPLEAIAVGKTAAAVAPDDALVHTLLGIAFQQAGEMTLAKESLTTALSLDPGSTAARQALAAIKH